MSLDNVRAFYERLASDDSFRSQIQSVNSKDEGREILQNSGYDFTPQEFEAYTEKLLETAGDDEGLRDLTEKELEAVFGGAIPILLPGGFPILLYGVIITGVNSLF